MKRSIGLYFVTFAFMFHSAYACFGEPRLFAGQPEVEVRDIVNDAELKHELARWLPSFTGVLVTEGPDMFRVAENEIVPESRERMRACMAEILRSEIFPPNVSAKTIGLYGLQKGESGGINADVELSDGTLRISGGSRGLTVRFRCPAAKRIHSSPLEELGRVELFRLMQELFLLPYRSFDEMEIHGKATVLRGTTVYTAQLDRRGINPDKLIHEGKGHDLKVFDKIYLFVSDSVPQYISFSFGACGPPDDDALISRSPRPPRPPFKLRPNPTTPANIDPDGTKRP